MKILYIHGYGGKANGSTSQFIKEALPDDKVIAPTYNYWSPNLAVKQINDYINQYNPDMVVSTSLGGFYVSQLDCGVPRIIINPATPEDLIKIDPNTEFIKRLEKQRETISCNTKDTVSLIFGVNDTVATHREFWVSKFAGKPGFSIRYTKMGHEITKEFVENELTDIIKDIKFWINIYGTERHSQEI